MPVAERIQIDTASIPDSVRDNLAAATLECFKSPATPNGSTRELQHERRLQRRKEGDETDKHNKTGPLRWHGNSPRHKDPLRS